MNFHNMILFEKKYTSMQFFFKYKPLWHLLPVFPLLQWQKKSLWSLDEKHIPALPQGLASHGSKMSSENYFSGRREPCPQLSPTMKSHYNLIMWYHTKIYICCCERRLWTHFPLKKTKRKCDIFIIFSPNLRYVPKWSQNFFLKTR